MVSVLRYIKTVGFRDYFVVVSGINHILLRAIAHVWRLLAIIVLPQLSLLLHLLSALQMHKKAC